MFVSCWSYEASSGRRLAFTQHSRCVRDHIGNRGMGARKEPFVERVRVVMRRCGGGGADGGLCVVVDGALAGASLVLLAGPGRRLRALAAFSRRFPAARVGVRATIAPYLCSPQMR